MIESRLDPALDGAGGGYGNYPGLTVEAVANRFRHLAEEGHNRSARAILRIVHEQTSARGSLGAQRYLAAFGLIATAVLLGVRLLAPETIRPKVTVYLAASAIMTVLFVFGAATTHRAAVRSEAQIREIRRLALLALDRVVQADGFAPKPLEREHLRSFGELRKADPASWGKIKAALGA